MAWTKEQESAIKLGNSNIIVSAGAGSGKTAVLTQRTIEKVLNGTSIDRLLILTFTNAAASEMKDRIRSSLKDHGLNSELDKLEASYITTFDSFALAIVKKYHLNLGLSKNINIMDSALQKMLEEKITNEIFNESYEDINFKKLIGDFCTKSDRTMQEIFLEISHKIDLNIDKENYLKNYIEINYSDKVIDAYITKYLDIIASILENIKSDYEFLSTLVDNKYLDTFNLYNLINASTYDEIKASLSLIGSPRKNKNCEEECSLYKDKIKENIDKLKNLTRFVNIEEIKYTYLLTKDYVQVLLNLKSKFDKKFWEYKKENNLFTFNDIAFLALNLVKNNEDIKNEIKNSFDEIMVDEYQDTSDIQESLLSLISENNLYMVGDIKQSIYRFRNANPYIFQTKYNNYSKGNGGMKIDLLKNFRSRKEVLDNINLIFNFIMDDNIGDADYINDHQMNFGNEDYTKNFDENFNYNMDILNYNIKDNQDYSSDEIEAFTAAFDIKEKVECGMQIFDKKSKQLRNAKYSDFAIIMDRGSSFDLYKKIFEYVGVPIIQIKNEKLSLTGDLDIFKNLINLIIKINQKQFDNEFRFYFASISRSYLINSSDENLFDNFVNKDFYKTDLFKLCQDINIYNHNPVSLIDAIIENFHVYEKLLNVDNIKERMVVLSYLRKLASTLSKSNYTILDFAEFLSNENLKDSIEYALNTESSDSVKILNIHKSKGLEYSICYFTGLNKMTNKDELKSKFLVDSYFNIITPYIANGVNETILKDILIYEENKKIISEKIRLFYVALTRCKEKMILICPLNMEKEGYDSLVPDNVRLNYNKISDMLESILPVISPFIKDIDFNKIKLTKDYAKKSNFNLNMTSNNLVIEKKYNDIQYNKITKNRFSKNVNKLITKNEKDNMILGTKIHEIFEYENFDNPKSDYVKNFLKHINKNYLNIYKEYEFIINENNETKTGIIDLLIEYENHFVIVDYKTNNLEDEAYLKQLNGYKNYIENITKKECKIYLYSVFKDVLNEI